MLYSGAFSYLLSSTATRSAAAAAAANVNRAPLRYLNTSFDDQNCLVVYIFYFFLSFNFSTAMLIDESYLLLCMSRITLFIRPSHCNYIWYQLLIIRQPMGT